MAGSSFTIPVDLADQVSLKRLLIDLAATLDVATGVVVEEGTQSLVTVQESIDALARTISDVSTAIDENAAAIVTLNEFAIAHQYVLEHEQVDILTYVDFDAAAWAALRGNSHFNAFGNALVNPPFVPVAGTLYRFFTNSVGTPGGGVVQRLIVQEVTPVLGGTNLSFYRSGFTFADTIAVGWAAT